MVTIHQILRAIVSHLRVPDENIARGIIQLIDEHEAATTPQPAAVAFPAAPVPAFPAAVPQPAPAPAPVPAPAPTAADLLAQAASVIARVAQDMQHAAS